ncbi:cyclic nucleotide-binding domain-containing protein [Pyxidicoccus fallax]|uniref:Cyclic nucleotide-binding domain-containing protein n=1 Tax=Pyxidicoccus fallax TaxID=394095 RepID=A0A848LEG8_9BACT|nr:cyclic nucleotide-binding domain-containing protein [Pyxidicoccus fallax]NMO16622.1 cyclic nucleotide-binding domain-containing protein [Pyxidicoccus fallax]NPC80601.1 cyclic nucleotide-binding domain-containing protein [Pyxidicoccus fallax]
MPFMFKQTRPVLPKESPHSGQRPQAHDEPPARSRREAADSLRATRTRGAELLASGDLEGALAAFQEVAKAAPDELTYRQKVAEVLQRLGRTRESLAEYQDIAEAWARTGWLPRAIAVCKVILQLDACHARARSLLRELHARRGLPPPASHQGAPARATVVTPEVVVIPEPSGARVGALRNSPFFSTLSPPLRRAVEDTLTPVTLRAGEQVLTRGEAAQALFVLVRGRCAVLHQHLDGHETPYPDLVEGDVFGEVSLLRSKLVTATVRTVTPCLLLKLHRERFERLLEEAPELRRELLLLGAERLSRTSQLLARRKHSQEPASPGRQGSEPGRPLMGDA